MSRILKVVIFGATGQTGRLLTERAVALLIDLLLIWYLTRPGVRAAFVRVDRTTQGTRGSI